MEDQAGTITLERPYDIFDKTAYDASCAKYGKLADLQLRNSDTIILGGYGCFLKVRDGSLSVETSDKKLLKLHPGTKIKQIILFSHGGVISFDAIEWACSQGVTVYLLKYDGELLQVLSPKQSRNAQLCYLQYRASESELSVTIAREIIQAKTEAQIEVLKNLPGHAIVPGRTLIMDGQKVTMKEKGQFLVGDFIWKPFEDGLQELSTMNSIDNIRLLEARLAMAYWGLLAGIPIDWRAKDRKKVPSHWHSITERISEISGYRNAHRANNPFHATLNFAYALLQADCLRAIHVAGLEPTVAFLHASQERGNALVWDVMECFRAIVDSMVIAFFQRNVFSKGDFSQEETGEVRMNDQLKRYLLSSVRVNPIEVDRVCRWLRGILLERA